MKQALLFMLLLCSVVPIRQAEAIAPPARYTISNSTVHDARTKLTWQQIVDDNQHTQAAAAGVCADFPLAGGGWRLPTISELLTIVDRTESPAIDPTFFPSTPGAAFWSSTPYAAGGGQGWQVDFGLGTSGGYDVGDSGHVRCVR